MPAGDYFFSWRVAPTVICGRNQEIDKEVNLAYCRENGIDVVRRRSGGGCVYADMQNFMFSYITASDKVTEVFSHYTDMIAGALRKLGFPAIATGRNDIQIGGKKVSGNAFYHLPGRSIAHGTMLYDFDPVCLANAITPSKAKLESKGVKSVPMRVTCLSKEGILLSPEEFEKFMISEITDGVPYLLGQKDIMEIKEIEANYYNPSFMKIETERGIPANGVRSVSNRENIKGLGEFCVEFDVNDKDNMISNFKIMGDFFMSEDVEERLCNTFNGILYSPEEIRKEIKEINPESVVPGLTEALLSSLILGR